MGFVGHLLLFGQFKDSAKVVSKTFVLFDPLWAATCAGRSEYTVDILVSRE